MALSPKEAARQILDELPDDASFEDVTKRLTELMKLTMQDQMTTPAAVPESSGSEPDVEYHLERRGRLTVLVPDRPVPTLTVEMVNQIIGVTELLTFNERHFRRFDGDGLMVTVP